MIIGILSDTHGNHRLMQMAVDRMVGMGASSLIHLGDDYADAEVLRYAGYDVKAVPGLWCPEYGRAGVPHKLDETIAGVRVVAVHSPGDLSQSDGQAGLVCHGHTHKKGIANGGAGLIVNPGHLKSMRDRGETPGFALATLESQRVEAVLYGLDGRVYKRKSTVLLRF